MKRFLILIIFLFLNSSPAMMQPAATASSSSSTQENINAQDAHGNTPLMRALSQRNYGVAHQYLKDRHLDINLQNNEGKTAFMIFLEINNAQPLPQDTLDFFMNNYELDFNLMDKKERTAFDYLLARRAKGPQIFELMRKLVPLGAKSGETIKEEAESHKKYSKRLKTSQATAIPTGAPSLQEVSKAGRKSSATKITIPVQEIPLEAKLALAVKTVDYDDVKKYLDSNANPNAHDFQGIPIFLFAINHPNIAKLFINNLHFNPNVIDPRDGMSALSNAIEINSEESIETAIALLWRVGINVNLRDKQGLTALDYAETAANPNQIILRLLKGHGAKRGKELSTEKNQAAAPSK